MGSISAFLNPNVRQVTDVPAPASFEALLMAAVGEIYLSSS